MTGPAAGKIRLRGNVALATANKMINLDCEIYLHVKGHSLARVTHVDLENKIFSKILPPKRSLYATFKIKNSKVVISLKQPIYVDSFQMEIYKIIIYSPELAGILGPGEFSYVYIGGKYQGILLGFKRKYIKKLESYAVKLGVKPR